MARCNGSEIVLIPESTFKSFPPKQFTSGGTKSEFSVPGRSVVTVIGDKEFCNYPKISIVRSQADLSEVRHQICGRPLVMQVFCGKHVPQGQKLNRKGDYLSIRDPEWWYTNPSASPWGNPYGHDGWSEGPSTMYGDLWIMPHFVASVDTSHSGMKQKLEEGFDRAESLLTQGKNFCIQFNFNPFILDWWKRQGPARYDQMECLTLTQVTGASFQLTNHSALNHCFDCHPAWCVCWPVYCVTALPYKVWRNGVQGVEDIDLKIAGTIGVARPEGPGYELTDLHRGAAVQRTEPVA